ncbi:alpha/beta fold hydrolase [Streptomyces sp. NPDC014894]|uniref:alpha/beta fold hydrolase n=1 Tax=Streptomyces sp. NPDC014894 TaxID=3364931 RepID=UPI0036FFA488
MFVRIGGVPHHVVVEGGGPPCVLSAGLGLSWFDWDPVVPLLAPHRTVVRFDRPGHGLSAPALVPPSAAGEAHRVAAVLDALGLDEPAAVVGHSIAGFHAEAFARLHPARTASLVLVDSSVEEEARVPAAPALRTAAARAAAGALGALGVPAALGPAARRAAIRIGRTGGGDPAPAGLVHRCYSTSRVVRGALLENAHYQAVAAELLGLRERRPLPAGAPVTVLAGTDGGRRWTARQRELSLALGARFREITPAGHLLMLDAPDAVARAVLGDEAPRPRGDEDRGARRPAAQPLA